MLTPYDHTMLGTALGEVVQVCLVTRDHRRTMDALMKLGVGPFRIYVFNQETTSDTRYYGQAHWFSALMGYASSANMMWEVVEPTGGSSIFEDVLARRGEGVHHFGLRVKSLSFKESMTDFVNRGFGIAQSGRVWRGDVAFAFIDTYDQLGVYLELTDSLPGSKPPEPDTWYPAPLAEGASL